MESWKALSGPIPLFEAEFNTKLQNERQSCKAASFTVKTRYPDEISITQHLCWDLDDLKLLNRDACSGEADLELRGVQLNIYGFQLRQIFLRQQYPPSTSENTIFRKVLIHLLFTAAIRLIHIFSTMNATGSILPGVLTHGASPVEPPAFS